MKSSKSGWTKTAVLAAVAAMALVGFALHRAQATALTADRATPERSGRDVSLLAASNTFHAGAMVCENGLGYAVPAADVSGYVVIGKNMTSLDNTGANYSATAKVTARRGVFRWANGGAFTNGNIGDLAYVADDQTVTTAAAATHDVVAGVIIEVDTSGVWVDSYAIGGQGAASFTTMDASGNAAVGGTLAVTGAATLTGNAIANELDARTATALLLGKATATGVTVGAADAHTTIAGNLLASEVDAATAAAMNVGKATATSLNLGASDITTTVKGPLVVDGNTAKLWMGTNGYFQITGTALQFVGFNGFTNAVEADITQ